MKFFLSIIPGILHLQHDIRQEVEQIMANVFYSTFLNVSSLLSRFLRFLTFLFLERFYIYGLSRGRECDRQTTDRPHTT